MHQQPDHDNFFYEYFPQFPYYERAIPCNPVQDYQLRELCPEKSKAIGHPLTFTSTSAHITTLSKAVATNIPQNLHSHVSQGTNSNLQPVQCAVQQSASIHQLQCQASDLSNVPVIVNSSNQSNDEDNENSSSKKKRTRLRHMINPEEWIRNKNKKARMLGQSYQGWIKSNGGKYVLGPERKALECGPPCDCKRSKRGKELKCDQVNEKERKAIFEKTCSMSWEAKKVWVQSHVEALEPKKKAHSERHRTMSIAYFLPTCSGKRKRVCRNMFLSTLGRNRRQVESWIKEGRLSLPGHCATNSYGSSAENSEDDVVDNYTSALSNEEKFHSSKIRLKPGKDSKKLLRKKACLDKRKKARDFLDSLTKTSLHNSLYVDSNFKTCAALYKFYKESVEDSMCVSTFIFFQEMKTKKIKLFKSRKGTNQLKNHTREELP